MCLSALLRLLWTLDEEANGFRAGLAPLTPPQIYPIPSSWSVQGPLVIHWVPSEEEVGRPRHWWPQTAVLSRRLGWGGVLLFPIPLFWRGRNFCQTPHRRPWGKDQSCWYLEPTAAPSLYPQDLSSLCPVIFSWTEIETETKIMNFRFTKTETKTKIIFKTKTK